MKPLEVWGIGWEDEISAIRKINFLVETEVCAQPQRIVIFGPSQHHAHATSMGAMVGYGAGILSPTLAGVLYPQLGLLGITVIDMATFAIAMLVLYLVPIPPVIGNVGVEERPEVLVRLPWGLGGMAGFTFRQLRNPHSAV